MDDYGLVQDSSHQMTQVCISFKIDAQQLSWRSKGTRNGFASSFSALISPSHHIGRQTRMETCLKMITNQHPPSYHSRWDPSLRQILHYSQRQLHLFHDQRHLYDQHASILRSSNFHIGCRMAEMKAEPMWECPYTLQSKAFHTTAFRCLTPPWTTDDFGLTTRAW